MGWRFLNWINFVNLRILGLEKYQNIQLESQTQYELITEWSLGICNRHFRFLWRRTTFIEQAQDFCEMIDNASYLTVGSWFPTDNFAIFFSCLDKICRSTFLDNVQSVVERILSLLKLLKVSSGSWAAHILALKRFRETILERAGRLVRVTSQFGC